MKNRLIFLIIIAILSGCRIYLQPPDRKFHYYKKPTDKNIVRTDGVYYNNYIKKNKISQTIIRFYDDYSAQLVIFDSPDTLIPSAVESFNRIQKERTKIDKGFYYIEGNNVKLEILSGAGHSGYHFKHYIGEINSKGELIIDFKGSKPYKKPRFRNHIRERIPFPIVCKFYKTE